MFRPRCLSEWGAHHPEPLHPARAAVRVRAVGSDLHAEGPSSSPCQAPSEHRSRWKLQRALIVWPP
jgi:hypothetical protein